MLVKNNRYTFKAQIGDKVFSDFFYTALDPLYNTVEAVKNSEVGYHLDYIDDETILLKLHESSIYADEIANRELLEWKEGDNPPFPVQKFVLEQTKHDLVVFRDYYRRVGYESASLADFDISSPGHREFEPLIDKLEESVRRWKRKIIGPNIKTAVPHKKDGFLGRRNLKRTKLNTRLQKSRDDMRYGIKPRRGAGELDERW